MELKSVLCIYSVYRVITEYRIIICNLHYNEKRIPIHTPRFPEKWNESIEVSSMTVYTIPHPQVKWGSRSEVRSNKGTGMLPWILIQGILNSVFVTSDLFLVPSSDQYQKCQVHRKQISMNFTENHKRIASPDQFSPCAWHTGHNVNIENNSPHTRL